MNRFILTFLSLILLSSCINSNINGKYIKIKSNNRGGLLLSGGLISELDFKNNHCHFVYLGMPMSGKYEIDKGSVYIYTGGVLGTLSLEVVDENTLEGEGLIAGTFNRIECLKAKNKPAIGYFITITELNVRAGAGGDYTRIESLSKGIRIKVVDSLKNGWYEIEKDGYRGFVLKEHIIEEGKKIIKKEAAIKNNSEEQQRKTELPKKQVKTQNYDDVPEIKSEEQKKKEEAEKQKRLEQEKLRKAEEERKRKEAEERKKQEEAKAINNNVSNAFGKNSGSSTSEGNTKGSGNQGYVTGDPNSKNRSGSGLGNKGDGFQLAGRSLVGKLPKPTFKGNEEGIVVIRIKVDRNGKVVNAEYTLKGSTLQGNEFITSAKKAALKTRFNADPNAPAFVYGTITYHFVLD